MSALGPVVDHIQDSHALIAEQLPIVSPRELLVQNGTRSTGLANKSRPNRHIRKAKPTLVLATGKEWRPNSKTTRMIARATGISLGPIQERKAMLSKDTANKGIRQEAFPAAHAAVRLVANAKRHWQVWERRPACH